MQRSLCRCLATSALIAVVSAGANACGGGSSSSASNRGTAGNGGSDGGTSSGRLPDGATANPSGGPPWTGTNSGPPATCSAASGDFAGLQMIECVPEGMSGKTGKPAPLVVALHGFTQMAKAYEDTTEWHKLAGRYGFYLIFPAAPGGRSFTWFSADRGRDKGDSVGIMAMVAKMSSTHDIRSDMVFVTGLSAGGFMTTVLLANYPDVFAAGAAIAGGPYGCDIGCMSAASGGNNAEAVKAAFPAWWNDASKRKPRLMIVQGDKDTIVSSANLTETMKQWTGALGVAATPSNAQLGVGTSLKGYPYSVYSGDGQTVDVATISISGMGHGTPIEPGTGTDQGGHAGDYAIPVKLYSPYYVAQFFGLLPP